MMTKTTQKKWFPGLLPRAIAEAQTHKTTQPRATRARPRGNPGMGVVSGVRWRAKRPFWGWLVGPTPASILVFWWDGCETHTWLIPSQLHIAARENAQYSANNREREVEAFSKSKQSQGPVPRAPRHSRNDAAGVRSSLFLKPLGVCSPACFFSRVSRQGVFTSLGAQANSGPPLPH